MRHRAIVISAVLAMFSAGCTSSGDGNAEPDSTATENTATASDPAAGIDASFEVGDYELHLSCTAESDSDATTIVYLHGLGGSGGDVHEALGQELAERGRLCTYDRVNVGASGREEATHTGADSVEDLHALLAAAEVRPPYVLLGFSFGGLLATMYTGTYPDEVEGILMLDSSLPTDAEVDALIPARERDAVMQDQQNNGEKVDFYATLREAETVVEGVPDIPVTYLAARPVDLPPNWPVTKMRNMLAANQEEFIARLADGRLVVVRSSHDIDLDRPEVVIAELDRLLDAR